MAAGEAGMPRADGLLDALAGLAEALAAGDVVPDVLHRLAARLGDLLGITGVGVSLVEDGRLTFVAGSLRVLTDLADLQAREQRGPCVDAVRRGRPVAVADLADGDHRWPGYADRALAGGLRAVASVPMRVAGATVGSVALVDGRVHDWSPAEMRVGAVLGDLAAGYAASAARLDRQQQRAAQLQHALDSRVVIEQAKGVVAAHHQVGMDAAFAILRRHANDHHATLQATAEAVVRLGLRP